jgi:hypothetical protein
MPYTVTWNEAIPAGTDAAGLIWQFIQNDKIAVRERIDSIFETSGGNSLASADPYLPRALKLNGASQSRILPGVISLNIRNGADTRDNVLITEIGAMTIHGRASAGRVSPTVAATTSVDLNTANSIYLEMTVSITTLTLTNPVAGAFYLFEIKQTGAGNFTITWPAEFEWPGDIPPTLTTTTGKTDIISVYYNGSKYIAVIAGLNYSV